MQQKKKEQYEGALESIFDFVFEQSQKPPGKVKPIKPTGVDGTNEMIDALGSILANPLLFVNDETIQAFKDGMDVAPIELTVGDRPTDKFKIKLSDLGDIMTDPGNWVDGQFKKIEAVRKMQRAAWAGEELKGALGYLWAKDKNLDNEARAAMLGAGRKSYRPTGASYEYMSSRTRELGSKYLSELEDSSLRDRLKSRYDEATYGKDRWLKEYHKRVEKRAIERFGKARGQKMSNAFKVWDKDPDEAVSNEGIYYTLESQSLREKSVDALRKGNKDEAENYGRASVHVLNSYDDRLKKEYFTKQKKLLRDYSKQIDLLKGSDDPQKNEKIKELKKSMGLIKSNIGQSRLENMAEGIGRAEGWYYSVKNMYTGGNLLPNIINGNFFDSNYNQIEWLQPSEGDSFRGVKFLKVKDGDGDPAVLEAYRNMTMPLYYASPVTLARSLTNGEVFAYVGHLRREVFKTSDILNEIKGFDIKKFLKDLDDGKSGYLDSFVGKITDKQMEKLKKFAKGDKLWGDLAYVFSTASRVKGSIEKFMKEKVFKEVRKQVGKVLLRIVRDKVAKELIKSWVAKGGIKVLIKGLVTGVVSALGFAGTPVTSIIIGAITWVLSEVVYQVGKVTIKFSLVLGRAVVFGFLGFVIVFLLLAYSFLGIFGKHSHVSPHEVVVCPAYYAMGLLPADEPLPGDPGWDGPTGDVPPFTPGDLPPGQQCLFSAGPNLRCSQGPYSYCSKDPNYINHYRPSHANSPAIDIAEGGNFHAPTFCDKGQGNCRVVATGQGTCGGADGKRYPAGGYVIFTAQYGGRTYQFYILHVAIGVNSGQTLGSGQAVATIVDSEDWRMCSSGLHAHLTIQVNGSYVDARAALNQDFQCNVGHCERDQCWPR